MSTEELPTAYTPSAIEDRWYGFWEENGFFNADPASEKEPWSLVIPPPNVTGALHMGHAFGQTQMDLYARRAMLQGMEVLFLPGMTVERAQGLANEIHVSGAAVPYVGPKELAEAVAAVIRTIGIRVTIERDE